MVAWYEGTIRAEDETWGSFFFISNQQKLKSSKVVMKISKLTFAMAQKKAYTICVAT